jgi:ubiquitin-like domain-containing CTD phosphatase 1
MECARPYMHKFLEMYVSDLYVTEDRCYEHYDIVIWSQTHWRWLESKLVELGIVGGSSNYKISFVLDRQPMFPVFTPRAGGEMQKHEVKPLSYIWAQFPHWGQHNVRMIIIC